MRVLNMRARQVLATNGQPTIEVEIESERGRVHSSAPMGTSTGKYEAYQLPAADALRKFYMVRRAFSGKEFATQRDADKAIRAVDETIHFREIGGNLATAMSFAFLKAFALEGGTEVWRYVAKEFKTRPAVPYPLCNVVGGWKGQSEFQEFLFLPVHQKSFAESVLAMNDAYNIIGQKLKARDATFNFSKNIESAWVTALGYEPVLEMMGDIADEMMFKIGLDVAASQLYSEGLYHYRGGVRMNSHEQLGFLEGLVGEYPISYVEDPFQEDDWLSFSTATSRWQPRMVCGDDFYATRIHRLLSSVDRKATSATIVKPNQVGTVTDAVDYTMEAQRRGLVTVLSHRSGETDDAIISHLAVGMGCDYAKFGVSGERVVKLNEVVRIEEGMNEEPARQVAGVRDMSQVLKESLERLRQSG